MNIVKLVCGNVKQTLDKDHAQRVLNSVVNKKANWKLPADSNWELKDGKLIEKTVTAKPQSKKELPGGELQKKASKKSRSKGKAN